MAIVSLPFISLILRPYVDQPISVDGWKYLFEHKGRNFDGELMAFGAMSGEDMDNIIEQLVSFGYVGPNIGDESDMMVFDSFTGTQNRPSWLELVDVQFFDKESEPVQAWKMKNSGVYNLIDLFGKVGGTKGYECDWPPLIGKIGGR